MCFDSLQPKKDLLDYKEFLKAKYDPEADLEIAKEGLAAHVLGEDEC